MFCSQFISYTKIILINDTLASVLGGERKPTKMGKNQKYFRRKKEEEIVGGEKKGKE